MGKALLNTIEQFAIDAVAVTVGFIAGGPLGAAIALGVATIANSFIFAPKSPKPATTETAIKQPRPPRVSAYGVNRLQGAYILYETASDGSAIDVWAFHDGQIDAITQYYLGDIKVSLDNGWVQEDDSGNGQFGSNTPGQGGGCVQIGANLGLPTETAFALVIAKVPDHWTTAHRGDGVVTGYQISRAVKAKNFQTVYASGGPNQTPMSLVMRAQLVFDWRDTSQSVTDPTTWKWSENAVLHLVHYLLVRMDRSWPLHFVPTLVQWTAAANDADVTMALTGVQTVLRVKASKHDTTAYPLTLNGLHVGMTISIFVSGDNTKTETRAITSIDTAAQSVSWSGGLSNLHPQGSQVTWVSQSGAPATEPRYRSCVVHAHTDAHKDVLAHLIDCCDGWLSPRSDGALVFYSGRYYAPTVTIGPDEIVSYSYQEGVAEEDAINTIKVTCVSANHDYNTVDCDDWTDEESIETLGKTLSESLDNQVPSFTQARRLAKRTMAKVAAPYRGTVTTTSAGRIAIGQRYVTLQIIEAGTTFYDGPAEIQKLTRNLQTGGVTFDWIAADPNVDAWDAATEEGYPAPVGNRVGGVPLDAPTITGATPDYNEVSDDGTGVRIAITVAGLDRDDVTWYARWRVQGAAVWNEQTYSDVDPSSAVELLTSFVPTKRMVEVAAAYSTGDGRLSDYSDPATLVNTATDQTAPDAAMVPTLVSWTSSLTVTVDPIARAAAYRWNVYQADGTTLVATHSTTARSFAYSSVAANADGIRRSYVVGVQGVNLGGVGTEAKSVVLSNPAPAAVTTPAIAGGATTAVATCDASADADVSGYAVFYSNTSGFNPTTTGGVVTAGVPSINIFGLAAGTYYGHIAATDAWTGNPALLNLSTELTFAISTGNGSTPSGGGAGGGGYIGRPGIGSYDP